jgi:hypothetical protein
MGCNLTKTVSSKETALGDAKKLLLTRLAVKEAKTECGKQFLLLSVGELTEKKIVEAAKVCLELDEELFSSVIDDLEHIAYLLKKRGLPLPPKKSIIEEEDKGITLFLRWICGNRPELVEKLSNLMPPGKDSDHYARHLRCLILLNESQLEDLQSLELPVDDPDYFMVALRHPSLWKLGPLDMKNASSKQKSIASILTFLDETEDQFDWEAILRSAGEEFAESLVDNLKVNSMESNELFLWMVDEICVEMGCNLTKTVSSDEKVLGEAKEILVKNSLIGRTVLTKQ